MTADPCREKLLLILEAELEEERIMGAILDEVLNADDTIIHSMEVEKGTKLLHKIEIRGEIFVIIK